MKYLHLIWHSYDGQFFTSNPIVTPANPRKKAVFASCVFARNSFLFFTKRTSTYVLFFSFKLSKTASRFGVPGSLWWSKPELWHRKVWRKGRAAKDQHTFYSVKPELECLNISVILSKGVVLLLWTLFFDRLHKGYRTVISKTDNKELLALTLVCYIK